ncbi:hypothetical protein BKA93DRAFT_237617 [Sparassis latifolia]
MPLPESGTLSLQCPRPGEATYSKPRQAMLLRMSQETLEALEGYPKQPEVEIELGANPGLYIGGVFFPMRLLKEDCPNELFLRTAPNSKSTHSKPTTPLKLYANVTGKGSINPQLGNKVHEKIRESTLMAEKQRTERKTILLEVPPDMPKPKKRKEPPQMLRKPPHLVDGHRNLSAPVTSQSTRVSSPATGVASSRPGPSTRVASPRPGLSAQAASPRTVPATRVASPHTVPSTRGASPRPPREDPLKSTRSRIIHCVATNDRTSDQILNMVGKNYSAAAREDLFRILEEVAERAPLPRGANRSSGPTWRLKTTSWIEVRPFDWGRLQTAEREELATQARAALRQLDIPETDPRWDPMWPRSRDSTPTVYSRNGSSAATPEGTKPETRIGIMSKDVKSKKIKPADGAKKRTASNVIVAKDEGVRPSREVMGKRKAKEEKAADSSGSSGDAPLARLAARRLPGSGFKATAGSSSVTPPALASPTVPQPPKKTKLVDVREGKRDAKDAPVPSGSANPGAQKKRKEPEQDRERPRERDRAREREAMRERDRERDSPAVQATGKKRKKVIDDDQDPEYPERGSAVGAIPKKRKTEPKRETKAERGRDKESDRESARGKNSEAAFKRPAKRDGSPLPPPRIKVKKEASPLPPLPPAQSLIPPSRPSTSERTAPVASSSSQKHSEHKRARGSSKLRRRSPIYTSSEDESEDPPTLDKAMLKFRRLNLLRPLPQDSERLQSYYNEIYIRYMWMHNLKSLMRERIRELLNALSENTSSGPDDNTVPVDPLTSKDFVAEFDLVEKEVKAVEQRLEELAANKTPAA